VFGTTGTIEIEELAYLSRSDEMIISHISSIYFSRMTYETPKVEMRDAKIAAEGMTDS
jgi:hypothetical protein